MKTVQDATFELMRALKLTTVFGNPGSTEEPFLKNFPSDFKYVLALQEASAVGMADGYAQATNRPAFVNLHTSAGMGNAMGTIITAFLNKTPLIITAGQQTREMIICEPLLTNRDETSLPKPWVKWSYEPKRAEDVPAALMRAYALALQPPAGPVFVSIPLDDWDKPALGQAAVRSVSSRFSPDPERLQDFAKQIQAAKKPVLIYGGEVDRSGGWEAGIKLAEKLGAPVFAAPINERPSFPENHPQYAGALAPAIAVVSHQLTGYDLALVIGAPVFRYYPYLPGKYLPDGMKLLQITCDPNDAGGAIVGDSLLGDAKLTIDALNELLPKASGPAFSKPKVKSPTPVVSSQPMTVGELFATLSELRPVDAITVQESPSNISDLSLWWPTVKTASYFSSASGGLGWGMPAAVGIALAEKAKQNPSPVIAVIGDGSFQYSVQSIYTAVQEKLKIIYIVPCNEEYAILKSFAELEKTPNVPALNIPGLDVVSTMKGFGGYGIRANSQEDIRKAFAAALASDGPTVIATTVKSVLKPLLS